jgi:Bacterial SH3 domain
LVRALIPGQRTRATALLAYLLLSLVFAMPASAAGPLKLTAGAADPDAGPAGSVFSFAATYVSKDDDPPAFVRVIVDGKPHEMRPINASDSDMRDGARYRVRFKIKVPGTYAFSFAAQDSKGRDTSLAGGTFRVTPKPKPKPAPTPRPAATSDPKPTPKPAATASQPTDGASTAGAAAGLLLDYDGGPGSGGPGDGGSYPPGWSGWPAAVAPIGGPDGGAGEPGPAAQGPIVNAGQRTVGAIAALAATLPGYGSDAWLTLATRSALIAAGSAAIVAMALFTFRRRRPDDEDPDDVPSGDEASADSQASTTPTRPALTGEMAMPRWRRPSLNEARKAPPGTSLEAIEAERLTFARGAVVADSGHERRRIRYRMVRLSDSPDDLLGQEIGRLDEGDEVELLERSGLYWQVRTPAGQIGWVHKMTLGDVVTTVEPSMSDDDAEADDDVLAAFTEAQARRAASTQAEPVMGEGLAARFIREHGVN